MGKIKTLVAALAAIICSAVLLAPPAHALDTKQDCWKGHWLAGDPQVCAKAFFRRQKDGSGFYVHDILLTCSPASAFLADPAVNGHELKIVNDNLQNVWRRTGVDIPTDCNKYVHVRETYGGSEFLIVRYEFTPRTVFDDSRHAVQFTIHNNL